MARSRTDPGASPRRMETPKRKPLEIGEGAFLDGLAAIFAAQVIAARQEPRESDLRLPTRFDSAAES